MEGNMKERLLVLGLIFLFVIGCKFGTSTAENDTNVDKVSPPRAQNTTYANEAAPESTPKPAATAQKADAVCPDPVKPCHHKEKRFDDWELSFRMPSKMIPNKTYSSAPFYAVIVKTYEMAEDCDGGEYIKAVEAESKRLQSSEPAKKVFASYECPNMGAVNYEFDGKWDAKKDNIVIGNFLAIYAGETKEDADQMLKKLTSKYPNAKVKRMTAGYEIIEQ
jgi:hypothetical protein